MPEGFVPWPLEIKDHPEFDHFPLNVLFGGTKKEGGQLASWSALYEPDFSSYKKSDDGTAEMRYHNEVNPGWSLVITYRNIEGKESYSGYKYAPGSDEAVRVTDGSDWDRFFFHLTMSGPSNGETCRITPIPSPNIPLAE